MSFLDLIDEQLGDAHKVVRQLRRADELLGFSEADAEPPAVPDLPLLNTPADDEGDR